MNTSTTFRPAVRWFLDDAQGFMPSSEESIRVRRLRASVDRLVSEYFRQGDKVSPLMKENYNTAGIELAKALERLNKDGYYDLNDLIDQIEKVKIQIFAAVNSVTSEEASLHRALRETLTSLIVVAKASDRVDLKRRTLELVELTSSPI